LKTSLLALIPARSGSKGLPNKNVLPCAGRPLIAWTIAAALDSQVFSDVVVSTDSQSVKSVAEEAGGKVPFLRPDHLARDTTPMIDVIKHAWSLLRDHNGQSYQCIVLLQPTSPLRTSTHIKLALEHYLATKITNIDTLASVCEVDSKYGWLMNLSMGGKYLEFSLSSQIEAYRRQDFAQYYLPNGAIYIVPSAALTTGIYGDNTLPFIMDKASSIDIDNAEDFAVAEKWLLKSKPSR